MVKKSFKSINEGLIPSQNLSEILKVDFKVLAEATFPQLPASTLKEIDALKKIGILKRMITTAEILSSWNEEKALKIAKTHTSDTVRGWAAFIIGNADIEFKEKLRLIEDFADDNHFGVREWAWMSVRSDIIENLNLAIKTLAPWTTNQSFKIRRFATEATRPRGVWAAHIKELKESPEIGLPLLAALKNDPERYVQDSVANWLNDAAKTQPQWVKKICREWQKQDSPATNYICKKALRSIKD